MQGQGLPRNDGPLSCFDFAGDEGYTNEHSELWRFCVYVESDYDTDLDGKCDLIKVYVQVPRAAVLSGVDGWKAPVLYEARPYNGGMATHLDAVDPVEDSVAFVDVSAKTAHHEDIS